MADLTPEKFKQLKPQFDSVDDAVIEGYIALSSLWVDSSWPSKLHDPALIAATCHLMTIEGLGADAQSRMFKSGRAAFQSIKSGEITLTRYQQAAGQMTYADWLGQTSCGQFFLQLLNMAKAGPRIAMGGIGVGCISGYAKDWPLAFKYKDGPLE